MARTPSQAGTGATRDILRHWREAVPHDRLAHLVRDCERAFRRALTARLAAHGVPFGHWSFVRILWDADGLTQKELSTRAGVMEPTTFAALQTMEAQGWITRTRMATNRKNVYVHLTPAGRSLEDVLVPLAVQTNQISTRHLATTELAAARKVLFTILMNLAEEES